MSSEFFNRDFLTGNPSGPPVDKQPYGYAIQRALALFRSANHKAQLGRLWARLRKKPNVLFSLPTLGKATNMHARGIQPVAIRQIRGSEGRALDFDGNFRPLYRRNRDRWVQIASLIIMGIYLPAVEVFQIGEIYYVRDGNHRISVMRAMGAHFIDARVVEIVNYEPEIKEAQAMACAPGLEIS
jgi:hypothetical protein